MNDPENFLTRWSRRKREEAAGPEPARDEKGKEALPAPPTERSASDVPPFAAADDKPAEPVFDLSTLPPIETITAETDIRAFFAPGVPSELRLAALRRAWVADPKVRDFVGLNDYDFDFHTPGAIPGFGSLEMTDGLRREVARIVTGWEPKTDQRDAGRTTVASTEEEPAASSAQPAAPAEETSTGSTPAGSAPASEPDARRDQTAAAQDELIEDQATPHRSKDAAAAQQQHSHAENLQTLARRGHGRALPK